ncbi:MAG: putative oxidoreductase [Acidimicrobiia bacterium]|nr:putative oxidoreductase [Acidimicrobiia bacterium]
MAMSTRSIEVGSSFANNLLRSPVEFAQASLTMQRLSGGRFEAGLGAGWQRDEIQRIGRVFPSARDRAGMYREAVTIVRDLFHQGSSNFSGEYYDIDVPTIGPRCAKPPTLAVSVGGPRTIREVAPLADFVELKANAPATRTGGTGDRGSMSVLATITVDHLKGLVELARESCPDAPLGIFTMVAVGDHPLVHERKAALGDSLFGGMVGELNEVADNLWALEEVGISRVQITEYSPGTIEALAPVLLSN